jgi:glycerate 2-kinase
MKAADFRTHSLRDARVARILSAALRAVDPAILVRHWLEKTVLPAHKRLFILGMGKASESMGRAALEIVGDADGALIVTKQISTGRDRPRSKGAWSPKSESGWPQLRTIEAGHPVPDERSLRAGSMVLELVSKLERDDLLLCLISGGASALVTAPVAGVALSELQSLTSALLECGAAIQEINLVRRHLDRLKGGGLAAATDAAVLSLILSDVIGDRLEAIASGPTALDPTSRAEASAILKKYGIEPSISIDRALRAPPPAAVSTIGRVENIIIGDNRLAAEAARNQAQTEGFESDILGCDVQGEAHEIGRKYAAALTAARSSRRGAFCMITGGETTVRLDDHGKGGRNQELALASVDILDGAGDVLLVSLATDGNDGPTDAAGAVVDRHSRRRALQLGMVPSEFLDRHDAYSFFDALGDLLKTGYTGTNVNDLMFLVGL